MNSPLWGHEGERWQPEKTLPDFSYAGYRANEVSIPSAPATWNLKQDFHAIGDGKTDDSNAFERAFAAGPGVCYVPAGKYLISRPLHLTHGNFVLRGDGAGRTVLFFPKPLSELFGNQTDREGQSQWSFGPGFLKVEGRDSLGSDTKMADVVGTAKRGDTRLLLSHPVRIAPDEWIRLVEGDPPKGNPQNGSLIRFLYGNLMPGGEGLFGTSHVVRFLSRVKSMAGNTLELERPLPYDVRPEWTPEIHRFSPSVREVGIERLSIQFPWSPYPGHFKEAGYNALTLEDVSQCWIRDVEIENADFAIGMDNTNFCTLDGIRLTTSRDRATTPAAHGASGHHGIDIGGGTENLVTHFDIRTKFLHDISLEWYVLHTVYADGHGVDLAIDHHREANYSNLFTNVDCGLGTRPFASGGSFDRGAHSGAYNVYWNIRAVNPLKLPAKEFGPLLTFVGISTNATTDVRPDWNVEPLGPAPLVPEDLAAAMRALRLGKR